MAIRRHDPQSMLHRGRPDPNIIRGYGSCGGAKGIDNHRIPGSRIFVNGKNSHPRGREKSAELQFIPPPLLAHHETCEQLAQDNGIKYNLFGLLENKFDLWMTPFESGISKRI
jgi:hypothetical protein